MFRRWTHTENNGGFHTVKSEGLSISLYPGTKTPNIQGAKMEILRKTLVSLSNTNNTSDSSESFDQEDQEEEHRLIKVETPEMEDEAEHCHDHVALMSDLVEVHAAPSSAASLLMHKRSQENGRTNARTNVEG